jgi:hypothetical protein
MSTVFTRETLLDTLVNIVPLAIIAFFVAFFLIQDPWAGPLLSRVLQFALLVVPFALLALLTYAAAKRIE